MKITALLTDFFDSFGNLATTIQVEHLAPNQEVAIILGGQAVRGLLKTFGEGRQGDLAAVIDSDGYLNICVGSGSAEKVLDAHVGDIVQAILT